MPLQLIANPLLKDSELQRSSTHRSVTLVDSGVADINSVLRQLPSDTQAIVLPENVDSFATLYRTLDAGGPITELHVISHGDEGRLQLGGSFFDFNNAGSLRSSQLPLFSDLLSDDAELLIYGCNFAANETGIAAVQALADATGATILASTDRTGAVSHRANWDLEVTSAPSRTTPHQLLNYPHSLDLNLTETLDPNTLRDMVFDPANTNVVINSVTVFGNNGQVATFTNGLSVPGFIDFDEGIVLSSGQVSSIGGPNAADGTGTDEVTITGADGDPDFNALTAAANGTFDASYIEINFTPMGDSIEGSFVFASEEYNEYAPPAGDLSDGNTFYDAMAFFVNGVNYSTTASGANVSINTVNANLNSAEFVSNDIQDDGFPTPIDIEPDGFTQTLTWTAPVIFGQPNILKFGVADGGDANYNSWLLIGKYAFEIPSTPIDVDLAVDITDNRSALAIGQSLQYEISVSNMGANATGREVTVTTVLPDGVTVNAGQAESVLETGTNADEWACESNASTPQSITCRSTVSIQTNFGNDNSVFGFSTDTVTLATIGDTLASNSSVSSEDNDTDASNNTATDSTLFTAADTVNPTLSFAGLPQLVNNTDAFTVSVEFDENVTGFTVADVIVSNAISSNFVAVDALTYTFDITPDSVGDITVNVAANVAQDESSNGNDAANEATVLYNVSAVGLALSGVPPVFATLDSYAVGFVFDQDVLGFTLTDISVLNGVAENLITFDAKQFSVEITPDGTGDVSISVADGAATDLSGVNSSIGASATSVYNISAPTVVVSGAPVVVNTLNTYSVSMQFSEDVSDFLASDISVNNGSVSNFISVDSATYTADVTPDGNGDVEVFVLGAVALDIAGNGNVASNPVLTSYDIQPPSVVISGLPARVNTIAAITAVFTFSETVTGFDVTDIILTNASVSNFNVVSAISYTADITPSGAGTITLDVNAAAVDDAAGNPSIALLQQLIIYDDVPPVLSINAIAIDNTINAVEENSDIVISGSSVGLETGQAVVVSVNGNNYTTNVATDIWSVVVPAVDLPVLDAVELVTVDAVDLAGNAALTASVSLGHDAVAPSVPSVIAILSNSATPAISGSATLGSGELLTVSVVGVIYTDGDGYLNVASGVWTLTIPPADALADGQYEVIATVTDNAGNSSSDISSAELQIDTTAPIAPVITPDLSFLSDSGVSSTDNITAVTTPLFSVPAGTALSSELIKLYANGALVGSSISVSDGSFEVSSSSLVDGHYAIRFSVTDAAGNQSGLSPSLSIEIDTSIADPSIILPIMLDNSINANEADAIDVGGLGDPGAFISVTFDDGVNSPVVEVTTVNGAGSWSIAENELTLSSLNNGSVSVIVSTSDIAGNSATLAAVVISLDTQLPVLPVVTALASNSTTPLIVITANPGVGGNIVVTVDGVNYAGTDGDLVDQGDGTWTLQIPSGNALSETVYDIVAQVTDLSGNTSIDNTSDELVIDTTAPGLPGVNPQASSNTTPTVSGTALLVTGEVLSVTINGISYTVGDDLIENGDGSWTLVLPLIDSLTDGIYSVSASVTDAAGNVSTDTTDNELLVDTVAPASPVVTVQISNSATPTLTGTATLGVTELLSVTVGGIVYNVGDGQLLDPGDGTWILTISLDDALSDGQYDVVARVTDSAGNSATDVTVNELTVDTIAPDSPLVLLDLIASDDTGSSNNDNITNQSTPSMSVPAGSADVANSVTIYANGVVVGNGAVSGDGSFEITIASLAAGNYAMQYSVMDIANNASSLSSPTNITIDLSTSVPLIDLPIEGDGIVNLAEDQDVFISGAAEAYATVVLTIDDVVNSPVQVAVTANETGQWSLLGVEADISLLDDGPVAISAASTDVAGNSAFSAITSISHAIALPVINVSAVSGDNTINASEDDVDILISGTTTGVEDNQLVTVTLNAKVYSAAVSSGSWSLLVAASDVQLLPINVTLSADVENLAGNNAVQATLAIVHDTVIPSVSIDPVSTDNIVSAAEDDTSLPISGTGADLEDGQSVSVLLNGTTYNTLITSSIWTVNIPAVDLQALPENNTIQVNVTDLAGNPAITASQSLVHDDTSPSVSIDSSPDANAANRLAYPLYGSCTSGDETVSVSIAGAAPASQSVLCNSDGEWFATFDVSSISDGVDAISVTVSQVDQAGNLSNTAEITVDKNTTIPSISIDVVATDDYINALEDDADLTVSGGSTFIEDGQSISVDLNSVVYVGVVASGSWSVTIPQAAVQALDSVETLSADGENLVGTSAATAIREIRHDATPPATPSVVSLVTNSLTPTITGNSTLEPGDVLSVTVDSVTYIAGDGNMVDHGDGTWELIIPSDLVAGTYDIVVTLTDLAGNVATHTGANALVVDVIGPNAPLIAPVLALSDDSGTSNTDYITNIQSPGFSVPAGSGVSGDAVTLLADGIDIGSAVVAGDGSFSVVGVLTAEGSHSITYTYTDIAGNESTVSPAIAIQLDTLMLAPLVDEPIENDSLVNNIEQTDVFLSGSAEANALITVSFDDNNHAPINIIVGVDSSGIWSLSGNEVDISALDEGVVEIDTSAVDAAGNTAVALSTSIVLDVTAPDVPTVNFAQTNTAIPIITGTATIGDDDNFVVDVNGVDYSVGAGDLLDHGNGTWELAIPSSNALTDGDYEVSVTVTDVAGNAAVDNTSGELTIDTVAPAGATVNVVLGNDNTPTIGGSMALQPGDILTVTINSVLYTLGDGVLVDNGDGSWSLTIPIADILPDGSFDVQAVVMDTAGNQTVDNGTAELTIDTVAPAIPAVDSLISSSSSPQITGTATLSSGDVLSVGINGVTYFHSGSDLDFDVAGSWLLAIPEVDALPDANYEVEVTVADVAGNSSSDNTVQELTIDTVDPVQPTVNSAVVSTSTPALTGTAVLDTGDALSVLVGGTTYTLAGDDLSHDGGSAWVLQIPLANALSQANYEVIVTIVDAAGNSSSDASTSELSIDTTPPLAPSVTALVTNDPTPTINGLAVLSGSDALVLIIDGITYTEAQGLVTDSGTWSLIIPSSALLDDGVYSIDAIITDLAGNSAADITSNELQIDTAIPTITIDIVALDDAINDQEDNVNISISGTTSGVEDNQTVTVTIDGVTLSAAVSGNSWSVELLSSDAQALAQSVTVFADGSDIAGNGAVAASRPIIHDVDAPIVSIDTSVAINSSTQNAHVVTGNCSPEDGSVSVTATFGLPLNQVVSCAIDGSWEATVDFSAAGDGVGVSTITALQTDAAGNQSIPASYSMDKDTVVPSISISSVGDGGDGYYNGYEAGSVQIYGSTVDVENFRFVTLLIDDGVNQISLPVSVENDIWSVSGVSLSGLNDGSLAITASVSDASLNPAIPAVENVVLDATAPSIVASDYGPGIEIRPSFSGNTDLPDGRIISIEEEGGFVFCTAGVGAGAWSCQSIIDLPEGSITLLAIASDAAGNTAVDYFTASIDFSVDSDADGIVDIDEGTDDRDGDGLANHLDLDADGDGINDAVETATDSDADTVPDFLDLDSDNDSIPDAIEGSIDSDLDGVADYLDLDSDNDGVMDVDESGVSFLLDANNDGRLDGAVGINGLLDAIETALDSGLVDYDADLSVDSPVDSDSDGIANYRDLDSDNDGVTDVIEAGGQQETQSGVIASFTDNNADGLHDPLQFLALADSDSDSDGLVDRVSADSDGDGLFDVYEAGGSDIDFNGVIDSFIDANQDGLHDPLAVISLLDGDTDSDSISDRIDPDSDDDGLSDAIEAGGGPDVIDTDSDGVPDHLDLDSDADLLSDEDEGLDDLDSDGIADYIDNNALADTDNDGINDGIEGFIDTDGDGIVNFLDLDSDGDGIDDADEGSIDTDLDGIPDFLDLDADNDGIPDAIELLIDTDADSLANYLDPDSDNDGIADSIEVGATPSAPVDSDSDGTPDYVDSDSDNDSLTDLLEGVADSDGDGIKNYLDTDSDGDGIADQIEGLVDTDSDGSPNAYDADSDDDGIPDYQEGALDSDADGAGNYIDTDSDGDGIADMTETSADFDGDGMPNFIDTDADGDSIPDVAEGIADTDGDSQPNYLDIDSDNDGIGDLVEVGPVPSLPTDTDSDGVADFLDSDADADGLSDQFEGVADGDGDGLANYIDSDSDADGIPDLVEGGADSDGDGAPDYIDLDSDADGVNDLVEAGLVPSVPRDLDGDGTPDYLDLDSDNDTISDLIEGSVDSDGDGIPDQNDDDSNGDGLPDLVAGADDDDGDGVFNYLDDDIDGDGLSNSSEGLTDSDGDGLPNYRDTDSDGDSIADLVESDGDFDGDGLANYVDTDADGDGIADQIEVGAQPDVPVDTDADGQADFLDLDSDSDNIPDSLESTTDTDSNGISNYRDLDADGDGIPDAVEGVYDHDADGLPNYIDVDADGDGLGDDIESTADTDADGQADYLDLDSDGDLIPDAIEGGVDTDSDGLPDYVDSDSDGDGIPDRVETNVDTDGDGASDYVDSDADGDGIADRVESGADPPNPVDTDGDGVADFRDLDSDGDGISDDQEGEVDSDGDGVPDVRDPDSNNDGIPDDIAGVGDFDADGILNFLDDDIDGDGLSNITEGSDDLDGDGAANYIDLDSDGDSLPDATEGVTDTDGDGLANYLDTDSDGDGAPDVIEGDVDTDLDSVPNYLDTDSDGDLIPDSTEGTEDTEGDGIGDYLDTDSDNDGIADIFESSDDIDGDGIPNYLDLDADGDSIADAIEAGAGVSGFEIPPLDTDNDGLFDFLDDDSDGDGIADLIETTVDSDSDGIANYLDGDADGDGIADVLEQADDIDADGILNFLDLDVDGDGIDDAIEGATDADGDGIPNFKDADADADGIPDSVEGVLDTDADGLPNYLDIDSDSDGVSDLVEAGDNPQVPKDTDGDSTPDYLDLDSDNDGLSDLVEGDDDVDGDGVPNLQDPDDNNDGIPDALLDANDADGDGIPNYLDNDIDGDGIGNGDEGLVDTDGDGVANYLDLDSDNDGIGDALELTTDFDGDGLADYVDTDTDGDGLNDSVEGNIDSDGDGAPDYKDTDSDNDGIADAVEGNSDADGDSVANYLDDDSDGDSIPDNVEGNADVDADGVGNFLDLDSDGDSINDVVEVGGSPSTPIDTDADGQADYIDTDSDNDGILDGDEGILDSDGDGIPNSSDLDSNNDGIPDAQVGAGDLDGDGVPNYLDADIDGDGLSNVSEGSLDVDADSLPNYFDLDSDGDGIEDSLETSVDSDGDGIANFVDADSDNDGIDDAVENLFDPDGDGEPNYLDTDSDNDGIPDSVEGALDFDLDGKANYVDTDADADGIDDSIEGSIDSDGDGNSNYLDNDSDNDGIPDAVEGSVDSDGDGTANFLDLDSDGDLIADQIETSADADGDGVANFVDTDSDGDGITDLLETAGDADADGLANYLDLDSDADGISDLLETGPDASSPLDSDADGLANFIDTDSDNDGIADAIEGVEDADGDSIANLLDSDSDGDGISDLQEGVTDTDADGIANYLDLDSDNDGIADAIETLVDTDGDGLANYIDSDSDGDSISDLLETQSDTDGDGIPNFQDTDGDGDGISDSVEVGSNPAEPQDSDADSIPDYLDTDSDNDGLSDSLEQLGDSDGDTIPDYLDTDSDNDGIADSTEGSADSDGDGLPAYLDSDSDGDGIADISEGEIDTDNDGTPDFLDIDSDADGITDLVETQQDADADGLPNYIDTDADGDGITDIVEGAGDTDADGVPDFLDTDSDDDGIPDALEGSRDSDLDGIADFQDTDSDGDQIADSIEQSGDLDADGRADYLDDDSDNDGISDAVEGSLDTDGDGVANFKDSDADGDGIPDQLEGTADVDLDGIPNYLDTDADGDGINDKVEASSNPSNPVDTDGDGISDYLDLDSNGDGIPDSEEGSLDSDGDGVPDSLDQDADNDGIVDAALGNDDFDSDGIEDALDGDIDGDGIPNSDEQAFDTDGDGFFDYQDTDSDNDGLPDSLEGTGDSDGDGIPNFQDSDSDGDGIGDVEEVGGNSLHPLDSDSDGIADYLDTDSDNDSISDAIEGIVDTDGDGLADYLDPDSDGDGISDLLEDNLDTDNDGAANYVDSDADGDGINDSIEVGGDVLQPADTDGDGIPDYLDLDSDNDGLADNGLAILDSDGDGIPDAIDPDSNNDGIVDSLAGDGDLDNDNVINALDGDIDGDGIANSAEGVEDADGDGIPNFLDSDADNDGIDDKYEGSGDLDSDGIANYLDLDSDGDGIADFIETRTDTDGDGVANFLDLDLDGDGIPDSVEGILDSDNDGIANYRDYDSDGDGIADLYEGAQDADDDGIPNYLDLDSDNDGIADAIEGHGDTDGDGVADFIDVDADADGIPDAIETATDSDGDGLADYLDLDSDNDLLPDIEEGSGDSDGDGNPDFTDFNEDADSDKDGISNSEEGSDDTDGDGVPNFLDVDSDGDGISDIDESSSDSDSDGSPNYLDFDSDNDGLPDSFEGLVDTDGDSIPNYTDTDSDNDDIPDSVEGAVDTDNDGVIDSLDGDSDNDGIFDLYESSIDSDNDGVINALDRDSDNDGITDLFELTGIDLNYDGAIDSFVDVNSNGIHDLFEDAALIGRDSDGDGVQDYLDLDSDNDGMTDAFEVSAGDLNGDGRVDNFSDNTGNGIDDGIELSPPALLDTDNDNIANYLDADSDQDGLPDAYESSGVSTSFKGTILDFTDLDHDGLDDGFALVPANPADSDADSIPDHLELDSDGDEIFDLVEVGGDDSDNDGVLDFMADQDADAIPDSVDVDQTGGVDSDNDGIDDSADSDFILSDDADGDGIVNLRDPDADGNGYSDQPISVFALGAALPDIDGDLVPDYQQAEAEQLVRTGVSGTSRGCAIGSVSTRDPILPLLVVIAIFYFLLRRHGRIRWLTLLLLLFVEYSHAQQAIEPATLPGQSSERSFGSTSLMFNRTMYLSLGVGVSNLEPETEGSRWRQNESSSIGYQLSFGYDFNRYISIEAHINDLGNSQLEGRTNSSDTATIGYQTLGGSALLYAGIFNGNLSSRSGALPFARVGLGVLKNSANIEIDQQNDLHLLLGIGLEYGLSNGFGLRAEYISFEGDVSYAQLAMLYRFDDLTQSSELRRRERRSTQSDLSMPPRVVAKPAEPVKPVKPDQSSQPVRSDPSRKAAEPQVKIQKPPSDIIVPVPAPLLEPMPAPAKAPLVNRDTDNDGVVDSQDICPQTVPGNPVDLQGCVLFNGVLEGVKFVSGSAELTPHARDVLDNVASQLISHTQVKIQIRAHTDNTGSAKSNQNLSKQRVIAVARYLIGKGIATSRLSARAYGESRPIANNNTERGRGKNRRVEIVSIE